MALIKAGLIQMGLKGDAKNDSPDVIKKKMLEAHLSLIQDAANQGVQVLGLQEIFNIPYVCAGQDSKWYEAAEHIPDGPTIKQMQSIAVQSEAKQS